MPKNGMSWEEVSELARQLPGVKESISYGTPALRSRAKLLARLLPDSEVAVVRVDLEQRRALLASQPETFFLTEHYQNHPLLLVRLNKVKRAEMQALLRDALAVSQGPGRPRARARK
jgi:hypothetical protein